MGEQNDPQSIQTLVGQGPKVIASIGGWNFPSEYFSKMVASSDSRQKFISSARAFITQHNMKGIDIDWEYPCSPARSDPVKITCEKFRTTQDAGGSCPADKDNLLIFLKEMREALGDDMYISVASQAAEKNWVNMNLKEGSAYVDHWHIMNYDYTVPDIPGPAGATMSPNQPLYTPSAKGSLQMSVDYTVKGYLAAGVPASKIMVGVAFYGHTWYAQGMSDWQSFGGTGSIQGECCGPFKQTYGAKPGMACQQCGVMMYSEIEAAGCDNYYDDETQSDIMYCSSAGKDSYTAAGTWITYQGKKSIAAVTNYSIANNLGGLFIFDTSMDTVSQGGQFSFELMNQMADQLDAATPAPAPVATPTPTPTPTPAGDKYRCTSDQCVASSTGASKEICEAVCSGASTTATPVPTTTTTALYKCVNNQCVASDSGVDMDTCNSLCDSAAFMLL